MAVKQSLEAMGLSLPAAPKPLASYVPAVQSGNLVFCSGQLPTQEGTLKSRGKVGVDVSEDEAYDLARIAALNALAVIESVIGSLDRITRVVRLTGYVNSADGFTDQPSVIDGASDFLVKLFGDAGQHSRVAVGVYQLPRDAPVEIDLIVEVGE